MSRAFTATQYLQVGAAVRTTLPFTIACNFRNAGSLAAFPFLVAQYTNGSTNNRHHLFVHSGGAVGAGTRTTTTGEALSSGLVSDNLWHHAAGVWTSTTSRAAYLDGGSSGSNATNLSPTAPNRTSIGAWNAGANAGLIGNIAHVAFWNVALTADEILRMGQDRVSPLLIRPSALICYLPYMGRDTNEIDIVGGRVFTNSGSTLAPDDEPLIRQFATGRRKIFVPKYSTPVIEFEDDFNRSNGSIAAAGDWNLRLGDPQIVSNAVQQSAFAGPPDVAVWDTPLAAKSRRTWSQLKIAAYTDDSDFVEIIARWDSATDSGYALTVDGVVMEVNRVDAGAPAGQVGDTETLALTVNDIVRVHADGNFFVVFKNDVHVHTFALDGLHPNGDVGGFSINNPGSNGAIKVDDFKFGVIEDSAPAGVGIEGDLAVTEAADTFAAAGTVHRHGALAVTEAADTFASAGAVRVSGSLSVSEPADSVAVSGIVRVRGSLALTEALDSFAANGDVHIRGNLTVSEAADTFAATGDVFIAGSFAATEQPDTVSVNGDVIVTGSLAVTEANDTASINGGSGVTGTLAVTEAADTVAIAGSVRVVGSLAVTELADGIAISGQLRIVGALAVTEENDFAAFVGAAVITGNLAVTEAADTFFASSADFDRGIRIDVAGDVRYSLPIVGNVTASFNLIGERD
jgi:hypothetical protein